MPYSELPKYPAQTKIIATLGPATNSEQALRKLIQAGVSVFRLNFSHGTFEEHAVQLERVRQLSSEMDRIVAVLGDLQGPKIRVGRVPDGGIEIKAGQEIIFRRDVDIAQAGDPAVFPCTYEKLVDEVVLGNRVLINDGAIRALAIESGPHELRCNVTVGGLVTTGKGINLPDSDISAPAITKKDWECVDWAAKAGLDFLGLSFVRHGDEIRSLKKHLYELNEQLSNNGAFGNTPTPVIAKIEKPQALANIESIIAEADGIMVARGDLGVEMDLALVPVIQKRLVTTAQEHSKPCIVATQMLESMIENASPTRAEAGDVANAIFEGADAVMLSGETAVGKHGPLAVSMMQRIAHATEDAMRTEPPRATPAKRTFEMRHRTAALAHGAWRIASDLDAKLVVVWSESGGTARYLSRIGLRIPIYAYSSNPVTVRRMALFFGVIPVHCTKLPLHRSEFARMVDERLLQREEAQTNDMIILIGGKPFGKSGVVNTLAVRRIGEAGREV